MGNSRRAGYAGAMRRILLSVALVLGLVATAARADERLDRLFAELGREDATADASYWQAIEDEIWAIWSQSGSATADYLLRRGQEALAAGDTGAAIEHLTALVETAPAFAEGWNARATAYYKAGLPGPALADIARVLTLEPRHFGALTGLGLILEEGGDKRGALGAFRAALAIHPHRADVREAVERLEKELQGEAI